MSFSIAETGLSCWRLAQTFGEFYPPEESVQNCLDSLGQDAQKARQHEQWYHSQQCNVHQTVIEKLYADGVDVWEEGRLHVLDHPHTESEKADAELLKRPDTINAEQDEQTADTTEDALESLLEFVEKQTLSADNVDEQMIWVDVLHEITQSTYTEIMDWINDQNEQANQRINSN